MGKSIKNKINKSKTRELDLLKAAENRLKTMRKTQIKVVKKKYKRKYNGALKSAKKKSKKIMRIIMEAKKLSPYAECFDPRLKNFMDSSYSGGICKRIFGQHFQKQCNVKTHFCGMCCNHHVGNSHASKLSDCKKKCTRVINGKKIDQKKTKSTKGGDKKAKAKKTGKK